MNSLIIDQLSLVYPNQFKALNGINLQIENGIFGLLGPNGAGKSSLMNTIVGLQKPSSGHLYFNEVDIVEQPLEIQKYLGFLPQDFGVYPKVSAYHLLKHMAALKGIPINKASKAQLLFLLEKVNLLEVKDKEVHTFSGGMKQRFGVAQALLGNPKIIIVDEPTAGLDPEERNRFNALLSDLGQDRIIILSTHLVEDVRNLCSKMAIIHKGSVVSQGSPSEFVKALEGRLWRKKIDKNALATLRKTATVVSETLIERELYVTVYSEQALEDYQLVTPSLEQAYFNALNH